MTDRIRSASVTFLPARDSLVQLQARAPHRPLNKDQHMSNDDIRRMYDEKDYLYAFDLDGKDVTLTIVKVDAGELLVEGGKKSKKPIVTFEGTKKKLALNHTNKKILGGMYGFKASQLVGKRITLYPTTTKLSGETVECIRVRPMIPAAKEQK